MANQDRQFIEAAMRYLALLEAGDAVSVGEFVETEDAPLRGELASYLEEVLASGMVLDPAVIAADDAALAERVAARFHERVAQHSAITRPRALTAVRNARKLSMVALARRLNLPLDLWVCIERGQVVPETIPRRLIGRLASVLRQPEAETARLLGLTRLVPNGPRLREEPERYESAATEEGTPPLAETAFRFPPSAMMSFAGALEMASPTPKQRDEWEHAE